MSTKDWIEKDYYKTLGLKKDATPDQIKKAFRKLARENHPDQNKDPKAEERFKEITEAHDILADPAKRKEYDEARSLFGSGGFRFPGAGGAGGTGGFRTSNMGGGINLDDLFGGAMGGAGQQSGGIGDLFGTLFGNAGRTGASTASNRGPRRGSDLEGEVTVPFVDAAVGAQVEVRINDEAPCAACRGTGAKAGTQQRVCPTCQGSGMRSRGSGGFALSEPCPDCRGRGLIVDTPCPVCNGSGKALTARTVKIRVPAGVTDGQRIRIKGKGTPGANGGAAGDLYVLVHVTPHALFGRKGDDLTVTLPITYAEAVLGGQVDVPTLDGGSVKLVIPPGTPSGRTFRVRGKGIGLPAGRTDLMATVEISVPKRLDADAQEALRVYASLAREADPRSDLS